MTAIEQSKNLYATNIRALLERLPQTGQGVYARDVLLAAAEQVDRCYEMGTAEALRFLRASPLAEALDLPQAASVAVPGVPGSHTQVAAEQFFARPRLAYHERFEEVLDAVGGGEADFGVLPVENSTAGAVTQTLDLIAARQFYICRALSNKIEHCFCAHPDTDPARIETVLSHPQALAQCAGYLERRGLRPQAHSNTATAAQLVGKGGRPLGCICSRRSAELYGLRVLEQSVQDFDENYTRFVCFGVQNIILPGADTISLALSFPHEPGALAALLVRFAACRLNLHRIVSMPIASRDFLVRFHLDFTGNIRDGRVAALLGAMMDELPYFRYLGNYRDITPQ